MFRICVGRSIALYASRASASLVPRTILIRTLSSSSGRRPLHHDPEPKTTPAELRDVVEFNFINTLDDGTIIEQVRGQDTARVKLGNESLLESMNKAFVGRIAGDKFDFVVTPEERGEAYDASNVHEYTVTKEFIEYYNIAEGERIEVPLSSFEGEEDEAEDDDAEEMTEATVIKVEPLSIGELGQEEYNITLDFNSELCDQNFNFHVSFLKNHGDITDPEDEFVDEEEFAKSKIE